MFDQTPNGDHGLTPMEEVILSGIVKTIRQGRPARSGLGACVYEAPNHDRCVAGHMMDESFIARLRGNPTLMSMGVRDVIEAFPLDAPFRKGIRASRTDRVLVEWMQSAHDRAFDIAGDGVEFVPAFIEQVRNVLGDHGRNDLLAALDAHLQMEAVAA